MTIYTIGFARKSAGEFFNILRGAGIRRLVDIRRSNKNLYAGFTMQRDLPFYLRELCGAEYVYELRLAPSEELFLAAKSSDLPWPEFERRFNAEIAERRIESVVSPGLFDAPTVLLCSESTPEECHRRLVAEYLRDKWGGVEIIHL